MDDYNLIKLGLYCSSAITMISVLTSCYYAIKLRSVENKIKIIQNSFGIFIEDKKERNEDINLKLLNEQPGLPI